MKIITQAHVRRGIVSKVPKRELFQEISDAVRRLNEKPQLVPGRALETWRELAIEVHD